MKITRRQLRRLIGEALVEAISSASHSGEVDPDEEMMSTYGFEAESGEGGLIGSGEGEPDYNTPDDLPPEEEDEISAMIMKIARRLSPVGSKVRRPAGQRFKGKDRPTSMGRP